MFATTLMKARSASAVAAVAVVALALSACSRQPAPAEPIRAVRTLTIAPDSAGGTLEYAAEVRARVESRLAFRVGGKVVKRNVELGANVKPGQVLAQLDPKDLQLGQDSAQAGVAAAQSNFDLSAADLQRYRGLKEQGFISAAELERREATLKSAQSALNQARSQLSQQGNQTNYALLVSDTAGVVTGVDIEPGAVVSAGTPVFRVAQDGPRDVVFAVPEDKLALIRALAASNGELKVRTWGDASKLLSAKVREVSAAADPATRTFQVKADVGQTGITLGQTATVVLELPRLEGLTRLPLSAVTESKGVTSVWLLDQQSMTVKLQPIAVGGASGNTVVVADGLKSGDEVVTAGVHVLTPGLKVKRYVEPYATNSASPTVIPGMGSSATPAASRPSQGASSNVR